MKGDIAFAGFMLTAEEWQALDADSRAQLIAVATRRMEPVLEPPRRFPEGTGKHEIIEIDSDCLVELVDDDEGDTEHQLAADAERDELPGDTEHQLAADAARDELPGDTLEAASSAAPTGDGDWEDFSDLNEI